jgi:hypothetical protein
MKNDNFINLINPKILLFLIATRGLEENKVHEIAKIMQMKGYYKGIITKHIAFVYLMKDLKNNYYKIGISNKPKFRESTLQSENPNIELIYFHKGSKSDEYYLHNLFSNKRVRGEWFNLNENDIIDIYEYFKDTKNCRN